MVIHYPFFGGPHNQALRLDAPLRALGIETTVLLPAEPGNAAQRLMEAGVDVIRMPLHRLRARPDPILQARFLAGFAADVGRIRAVIRKRGIDVVEVNGLVNSQGALAGRREGVPVVWQLLDTRAPPILRSLTMPIVRRLSGAVMSTGVAVADAHGDRRDLAERLVPFYPPVDTDAFRPSTERRAKARAALGLDGGDLVVGCVANITPQKGLEHFVSVASRLRDHEARPRFVLFGRPMETQARYLQQIRSEARTAEVAIHDPGADVESLLPALDLFLLTSVPRSEGISTTVLEAMSVGLPVVATDVGALREAVEEGVTGLLVPPLDDDALAAATSRLLSSPELRSTMSRNARARAIRYFDSKICAKRHLEAYEIARARQPPA